MGEIALAVALRDGAARLAAAGIESAPGDARLLIAHALGREAKGLTLFGPSSVTAAEWSQIEALIARRAVGEPVARILGRREFWSLAFQLTPATLDPRPDSETAVEAALALVPDRAAPLTLLDLGTGSGCLLLALLSELPAARGIGVDRNPAAALAARTNAAALGLTDRAAFIVGDWGAALAPMRVDLLVSNPPYIPSGDLPGLARDVRDWDPPLALDGGPDGLDCYRALAIDLPRLLRPGAGVALEIGWDQADAVSTLMRPILGASLTVIPDLAGRPRVVRGVGRLSE